jgi:hypothetical protein
LALLFGIAGPAAAANLYCCTDATGKQLCADLLPSACYGRAYREVGISGRTVRMVDAPLNSEQRIQRAAEEVRKKEQEALANEQHRKDQALLNTYGSEQDIEMMRVRAQDDVHKLIRGAQLKIDETQARRKHFEDEAEFYKKKQLPPEVQKGLRNADLEIKAQEDFITTKKQELEALQAKYDEEIRRYRELTHQRPVAR